MKLTKKTLPFIIVIILLAIILGILTHYVSNYKQYQKYCEGECTEKIVSNQLLDDVIANRSEKETRNIQKDVDAIERDIVKLNNADLNENEQEKYDSYIINPEFNPAMEYDIDQLIEFSKAYDTALSNYDSLIEDNEVRTLKDEINEKQEQIEDLLGEINKLDLSSEEQADHQQSLDYYNQIDYDNTKDYTSSELNVYLSEYGLSEVNFENDLQTYQMVR